MTQTARKHAWLHSIAPAFRQMAGVISVEIALVASWTLLADTLLGLLSGGSLLLVPLSFILAVSMLAWLEVSGSRSRLNCPLQAFGLALITLDGGQPGQWRVFLRILLLVPLTLLAGAAFIRVPGRTCHLLQCVSGTRLIPLDTSMDPRMPAEVARDRRTAMRRVLTYAFSSVTVAVVILLIPEASASPSGNRQSPYQGLSAQESELLAGYLEMAAIYPDSIEFHVRLASLYYRNGMTDDLELELEIIRGIDPDHPMLLLGEDLPPVVDGLEAVPEARDSVDTVPETAPPDSAAAPDSLPLAGDSPGLPGDSAAAMPLPPAGPDTLALPEAAEADSVSPGEAPGGGTDAAPEEPVVEDATGTDGDPGMGESDLQPDPAPVEVDGGSPVEDAPPETPASG